MILKRFIVILLLLSAFYFQARSQILISLLLGDKLNSDKIEFGLEGGVNYAGFQNLNGSKRDPNLNLGFYFYFKQSPHSYIQTGVLVKQDQGARNLSTYPTGNQLIDSLYSNGSVTRKIGYFQVPFIYHYRSSSRVYLEGGFQVALRNRAKDYFLESVINDNDAIFIFNTKENYKRLDAGLLAGAGYKFRKRESGHPGMSIGTKYYYGLVNVSKNDVEELMNDSFYIYIRIPIGGGAKPSE